MPDLIESMFYVGETPWHGKGVPLTESPTIEDALILAGMDWQVQKIPTTFQTDRDWETLILLNQAYIPF